jgi:hypothetical protein
MTMTCNRCRTNTQTVNADATTLHDAANEARRAWAAGEITRETSLEVLRRLDVASTRLGCAREYRALRAARLAAWAKGGGFCA